jgi:hypothetical protein
VVGQPEDSEEKLIVWFARPRSGSAANPECGRGEGEEFQDRQCPDRGDASVLLNTAIPRAF